MPRSKASYRKAAQKAARTRKRNAMAGTRTSTPAKTRTRRRVTRKTTSMLSELFNPKMAQAGGKAVVSGAVGGLGAGFLEKIMTTATPNQKLLAMAGASFATATVLKMPNVGAGMAGVAVYKAMETAGMLAEDDGMYLQDYSYAKGIEQLPAVLNENGEQMYLQESDDDMFLQENNALSYGVGYPSSSEFWS